MELHVLPLGECCCDYQVIAPGVRDGRRVHIPVLGAPGRRPPGARRHRDAPPARARPRAEDPSGNYLDGVTNFGRVSTRFSAFGRPSSCRSGPDLVGHAQRGGPAAGDAQGGQPLVPPGAARSGAAGRRLRRQHPPALRPRRQQRPARGSQVLRPAGPLRARPGQPELPRPVLGPAGAGLRAVGRGGQTVGGLRGATHPGALHRPPIGRAPPPRDRNGRALRRRRLPREQLHRRQLGRPGRPRTGTAERRVPPPGRRGRGGGCSSTATTPTSFPHCAARRAAATADRRAPAQRRRRHHPSRRANHPSGRRSSSRPR